MKKNGSKKIINIFIVIILLSFLISMFLDMTDVVVLHKYVRSGMYLILGATLLYQSLTAGKQKE